MSLNIKQNIKHLDIYLTTHLYKYMSDNDRMLIHCLKKYVQISNYDLYQILNGAFVVVVDGGKIYNKLRKKRSSYARTSSHPSCDQQYAIDGVLHRTFLFGTLKSGKSAKTVQLKGDPWQNNCSLQKNTWFQYERHGWGEANLLEKIGHIIDYLRYTCVGHNVGPYGVSPCTGRPANWKPLILSSKKK